MLIFWISVALAAAVMFIQYRAIKDLEAQLRSERQRRADAIALKEYADEQRLIAFAALEAREDYTKDHQMLVAQARDVIEGEGGRPPGIWVGDEFVPVEPGEDDDVEVGQPVSRDDHQLFDDPYAIPREVIAHERHTRLGWFPLRFWGN